MQNRLGTISRQIKRPSDEEFSPDAKFEGGRSIDERVPQRFFSLDFLIPSSSGRKDLEVERKQASFNIKEMNHYIHGSKEIAELREKMLLQFERDPTFRLDDSYDLTKNEQRQRVMTRVGTICTLFILLATKHDSICQQRINIGLFAATSTSHPR